MELDGETLLWLGCPGVGKTVAPYIIGCAMACAHIWEDGKQEIGGRRHAHGARHCSKRSRNLLAVAADFDCFKNEPGTKHRCTLFDYAGMDLMPIY